MIRALRFAITCAFFGAAATLGTVSASHSAVPGPNHVEAPSCSYDYITIKGKFGPVRKAIRICH